MNDDGVTSINSWNDTNESASLSVTKTGEDGKPVTTNKDITSPKAYIAGTSLDTDATGAGLVIKEVDAKDNAWADKDFTFTITPKEATYTDDSTGTPPYGKERQDEDRNYDGKG